jgi:antitoxin HicB
MAKRNPHLGTNFDDYLNDEGMFEEVQAKASKRALSEQIEESMQAANLSKEMTLPSSQL